MPLGLTVRIFFWVALEGVVKKTLPAGNTVASLTAGIKLEPHRDTRILDWDFPFPEKES